MTDTKKEIKRLKALLPHMRERLSAVAFLLVLSLVMVTATSYAWITLSSNPEVGGVNTTVAANGSLEVALSDFDGEAPEESGVDSFSAEGQTTHGANTTWGNLVNLSTGYGVENLVLRPAKLELDADALLYGVRYGQDGRVEGSASDFGFTTWYQTDAITNTWKFVSPDGYPSVYEDGNAYGVRAISSVTFQGNEDVNQVKIDAALELQREAKNEYYQLTHKQANVDVLTALVDDYMNANIKAAVSHLLSGNDGPFTLSNFELNGNTYVEKLTAMLDDFYNKCVLKAGDALVYMANLQKNEGVPSYTLETLLAEDRGVLLQNGVKLTALGYNASSKQYNTRNVYKELHDTAKADLEEIRSDKFWEANGANKKTIYWYDLEPIVNHLLHIDTVTVDGKTVGQIGGMGTGALDYVNNQMSKTPPVVIHKGNLYDFEDLTAEFMEMRIPVEVEYKILGMGVDYSGIGVVQTSVSRTKKSRFAVDMETTETVLNVTDNRTKVAQDTYGMVLDLWIRTNGQDSMLTLNGTPKIREFETQLTIPVPGENEPCPVYLYDCYTGKMVELPVVGLTPDTTSIEVYKASDGYFYNRATSELVYWVDLGEGPDADGNYKVVKTDEPLTEAHVNTKGEPVVNPKMITDYEVTGYESANRIWKEDDTENNPPMLAEGEISATQGSGSCYIFYADSPEAYERSKELLSNLKLVFLNSNGGELARAFLDVDHIYSQSGKYTVPIVISSSGSSIVDEEGNEIRGICNLRKNQATQISVLVYLDGEALENDMVLSSEAITGSLNLQFDSTEDLRSIGDSELSTDIIKLSADVDTDNFTFDGTEISSNLKATIEGLMPTKVEAAFMRQINDAQGTRMATVELKDDDKDNTWTASVPFSAPGTYVLNSLWLDGVEYPLPKTVTVTVEGFKISSVTFNEDTVMTADRRVTRDVVVLLAADQAAQPKTVEARFMTKSGHSINASLKQNGDAWTGSATFFSSGTYTLQYLVMDGEYYELNDGLDENGVPDETTRMQRSFTAYLGLTTRVELQRYITDASGNQVMGPLNYFFEGPEDIYVSALIYDDAGNVMPGLDNVELWYKSATSVYLENGFNSELTWDGESYTGVFSANKAGSFVFAQMDVGEETINSASSAMTLQIIPKNPPSFVRSASEAVIVNSGTAYYQAVIEEASTAKIWAVLNNGTADYEVEMTFSGTTDTYQAAFPDMDVTEVFSSNGNWTVKELRFTDVYANGKFYDAGGSEKYVIPVNSQHTVLNYVKVDLQKVQLGGTKASRTGEFATEYKLKDHLSFTVSAPGFTAAETEDFLSMVNITLTHSDTLGYGDYSIATPLAPFKVPMAKSGVTGDVIQYTATDKTVVHAGTYAYAIEIVTTDGKTFNTGTGYKGTALEIFSKKPTVAITNSVPAQNTTVNTDKTGVGKGHASETLPARTATYAKVVFPCSYDGSCGSMHNYSQPKVTITISNMGNASAAELSFGADAHVYNGSTRTGSFTWSANNTPCERNIGLFTSVSLSDDGKTVAGTITANTLTLTIGTGDAAQTCTVSIPTITIENPY